MKYKLIVREYTENDKYEERYATFQNQKKSYIGNYMEGNVMMAEPERFIYSKALEVSLTDDEYKAVKAAVLETF